MNQMTTSSSMGFPAGHQPPPPQQFPAGGSPAFGQPAVSAPPVYAPPVAPFGQPVAAPYPTAAAGFNQPQNNNPFL